MPPCKEREDAARAVRIGVGLKIDDKTLADPLMGKQRQAGLNLVGDRRMVCRFDGKLAAAARRTENAAAAARVRHGWDR